MKLSFEQALEKQLNFLSLPNASVKYSLIRNGTLPTTHYFNKLVQRMIRVTLEHLAQRCNHLRETFCGVWIADNFPAMKQGESFQIVNTELRCRPGRHGILFCTQSDFARRGKAVIVFWDSLGKKPKT